MSTLRAAGFPEPQVRMRARLGAAAAFPDRAEYGRALHGARADLQRDGADPSYPEDALDRYRLVPPVFVPRRFEKLVELAREPGYRDVVLDTRVGGFQSTMPLYLSAFGSTEAASVELGMAASRQAGRLGIPMVVGENVMPVNGYGRMPEGGATPRPAAGGELQLSAERSLLGRISAYLKHVPDGYGGVAVQQSTEDADAEVWNLVYSDPNVQALLESGRLAFELKVGQGAKPGLGGMTLLDRATAARLRDAYALDPIYGTGAGDPVLRSSTPGTFTEEILRQQVRLMRNNYPRAKVWVKLPPARDVRQAALVAWDAGADAVTVDGAEAGTGWGPLAFFHNVGLPLAECLRRVGEQPSCLLVSGRMWEGSRVAKCLALGADAAGLGRAALIAVDTDPEDGLVRLVECLALELQLLASALGKYDIGALSAEDLWIP